MAMSKKSLFKRSRVMRDENVVVIQESSSDSSEHGTICYGMVPQEHARPRLKLQKSSMISRMTMDDQDALSKTSLSSSITRFRGDFDTFKCKMRVFGESLHLCRCIADDFRVKLEKMDKRLENLERRQKLFKKTSNYSQIIQKNKLLSQRSMKDVRHIRAQNFAERNFILAKI
ncbi:hypothetical protein PYW08_011055 [Mythimna loreyi]|uniref:Uncharacterized protein n=1 Tax=Mythimna loreyi TaxID=667449 RepID=A0ACC2Q3I8_9NEOP|nr:hypothetical protein PYW08_011055 [Mythimna loreyi]